MRFVIDVFRTPFAWRAARNSGVWLYQENRITHERRAIRLLRGVYQPIDFNWLHDGRIIE